ncbi:uncharacterized protein LOC142357428 [Convolutriloba macropyga]|uniref:uncharacterized protein LOC142357428 n=1 Tax=Convolutriloba macropyga TaxID=536237 RepID=UPI003F5207A7
MKNYHFALADYQQALDLDKDDWDIKSRISLIFNEFAIMDYFERRYLEAEEKFTFALQHNPKVSQYYISRARVRHLLDFKKGAREDVLCAMHLSPSNEELFSLIARLFPGKQIAEIRASGLFQATARRLHDAFQMSAPKKPKLRPLSAASLTTQLAGELSNEIHVLTGPSTSSATSRSLQRSAGAITSRSQRSGGAKGSKSKKASATSASRVSESKQGSKYDRDYESLRNESSTAGDLRSRSGQKGVKTPVDDIYDDLGRDSASLLAAISPAEFFEQKKRLNEDVRKMYQTAHQVGAVLPKRTEVLVNADHLKNRSRKNSSRWGSANKDTENLLNLQS